MASLIQQKLYKRFQSGFFTVDSENNLRTFVRRESIHGIDYYIPNDETWQVIAVDHDAGLAHWTGFYELNDFYDIAGTISDYAIVNNGGELMCKYEVTKYEK